MAASRKVSLDTGRKPMLVAAFRWHGESGRRLSAGTSKTRTAGAYTQTQGGHGDLSIGLLEHSGCGSGLVVRVIQRPDSAQRCAALTAHLIYPAGDFGLKETIPLCSPGCQ